VIWFSATEMDSIAKSVDTFRSATRKQLNRVLRLKTRQEHGNLGNIMVAANGLDYYFGITNGWY